MFENHGNGNTGNYSTKFSHPGINHEAGTVEKAVQFDKAVPEKTCLSRFLAPGTYIISSGLGGGTASAVGTSAAAPHVAGLYAEIKAASPGISVADATAWILANGVNTVIFGESYTLKRVWVPTL